MRRKVKRTTKQFIIVAVICIVVIGGAATFTSIILTRQIKSEYLGLLEEADQEKRQNQRSVYVASSDIMSGDFITEQNILKKTIYSSQHMDVFITEEALGKAALIDIPTDSPITGNMLTGNAITSELRELEYDVIQIGANVAGNDTVDVRICYPDGESYVILSKKILRGLNSEAASCLIWMNEEEIHRMSAAIVDAGLYSGSKLFVTRYIEPSIQSPSIVTYTPSLTILSLLESDPNIVNRLSQKLNKEIRKALENRMAQSMEVDVSDINWDVQTSNQFISDETAPPAPSPPSSLPPVSSPDEVIEETGIGELGSSIAYHLYVQEDFEQEGGVGYEE